MGSGQARQLHDLNWVVGVTGSEGVAKCRFVNRQLSGNEGHLCAMYLMSVWCSSKREEG